MIFEQKKTLAADKSREQQAEKIQEQKKKTAERHMRKGNEATGFKIILVRELGYRAEE